jgi:peroxiredoxin
LWRRNQARYDRRTARAPSRASLPRDGRTLLQKIYTTRLAARQPRLLIFRFFPETNPKMPERNRAMKKLFLCAALLTLSLAASISALSPRDGATPAGLAIGSTLEEFKLPDANGKERALSSVKGAKGTVLIFVSTRCPVSNAYNERMEKLALELKARGVNVVGINSNVEETPDEMKQHALEKSLSFTLLKDKGNVIADRLGAQKTPEAFFLDASNKLLYRGRIDDTDPRRGEPTASDLRNAVDETLAGKPVTKPEGLAFGCSIKRAS